MTRQIILVIWILSAGIARAQTYSNQAAVADRVKKIQASYPDVVKAQSLIKTVGGKDIWVVEIGEGDRANHPGIVIIGGAEGSNLLGQELAMGFAERLTAQSKIDSIKKLLASAVFYVFPNVSPDAAEQYFATVKYERNANARSTDDDRDGKLDEDPFEDLNKDGWITCVRVEDPAGKWKTHPADDRVMVLANSEKGELGKYTVVSEGIDNDKDTRWNEDPEGGVQFNKNLTYDPPYFTAGAGEVPVSELENRALLDFLYDRFNVFAVISFSSGNNLSDPWKFDKSKTSQRVVTGILENDAKVNKLASDLYKKLVPLKDAPASPALKGDILQWAYFHYGRQSFSSPGWWPPKFEIPKDTIAAKKFKNNEDKNTDVDFLRLADREGWDVFVPWQKINHPDFPEKNVEVGGIKPFTKIIPPFKMVDKLIDDHTKFILTLAGKKPEIDLVNLKTESLGNEVTRLTITIQNKGLFPALSEIGQNNYFIKLVKVTMSVSKDQLISGNQITLLPNLGAGESKEMTWVLKGRGKLTVEAGAPQTGYKKLEVTY
jgi:Zinc carboxypeptidase